MEQLITKTRLENGLQVQLKEIHSSPIISSWVWYRVGSRNETPGITGISHWVEHMQFKGTRQFPPGVMDKIISREGGMWNAFTFLDWTTFLETMPAEKIDIALKLESDRMVNSVYDPAEVASERTVIISEREGNENEPMFQLGEAVQKTAFSKHPYHYEIIGEMADLKTMQRDDLYNYYKKYYTPSNAVLAIAGDFDTKEMLVKINGYFAGLPSSKPVETNHNPRANCFNRSTGRGIRSGRNGLRPDRLSCPRSQSPRFLSVHGPGQPINRAIGIKHVRRGRYFQQDQPAVSEIGRKPTGSRRAWRAICHDRPLFIRDHNDHPPRT